MTGCGLSQECKDGLTLRKQIDVLRLSTELQ